jgi:four helix bundle protein
MMSRTSTGYPYENYEDDGLRAAPWEACTWDPPFFWPSCDSCGPCYLGYSITVRMTDQLNRAPLSIAANLAEGNGRFTKADRKHFFMIARASIQECVPLLELARRRKLVGDDRHAQLKERLEEVARMLSGLIKGLEHRNV